jgi:hypothetical protein
MYFKMRIINSKYETNILDWYTIDSNENGIIYTQKFVIVNTPNNINKHLTINYNFPNEYIKYIKQDMDNLIDFPYKMNVSVIDNNIFVVCIYEIE